MAKTVYALHISEPICILAIFENGLINTCVKVADYSVKETEKLFGRTCTCPIHYLKDGGTRCYINHHRIQYFLDEFVRVSVPTF